MSQPASKRLSILITNDDGYDAPGINALAEELARDHDITVVAPDCDQSGMSAAISVRRSITFKKLALNRYAVSGTPADAAHIGVRHFMRDAKPDLVVSGINRGPNLGNDTLFSGTVGAANCASLDGISAIAVSMGDFEEPQLYNTAAQVVAGLIRSEGFLEALTGKVLNVNVPNKSPKDLKGIALSNLGLRMYPNHFNPCGDDPDGALRYAGGDIGNIGDEDTDVRTIERGEVSLTFLRPFLQDGSGHIGSKESTSWRLPPLEELFLGS